MKTLRYFLIMLFFVPGLALAQDSLRIDIGGVENALAFESNFGFDIVGDPGEVVVGPSQFVVVESDGPTAPDNPEFGCDPYTPDNAAAVAGNVAVIARGGCAFVTKVQNAVAAGAIAALIYVSDPESGCGADPCGEDGIVFMGGTCTPDGEPPEGGCSIPAISTSLSTGQDILLEIKFEEEGTFTCEVCTEAPQPPPPATVGTHNTGVVAMSVYDYGFLGANALFAQEGEGAVPFTFGDEEGALFVSSLLVGQGGVVNTNPYTQAAPEFENVSDVQTISPPAPFDEAFETSYSSDELGVLVTQRTYSRSGDAFVIAEFEVENTTGSDLNDVYIGLFADWDTGETTSTDDSGAVNEDLNLVYVFDPVEGGGYYGVAALGEGISLSGSSVDATTADDAQLFEALTSTVAPADGAAERAGVTGVGPFSIAAGTSTTVQFAYVAGIDEADLFAETEVARGLVVSAEATAPEGTYVLGSAYPNPVSSRATISFELPTAQDVTLKVYDVLGREVATLVDGTRQAGPQSVEFDVASLPSGVYVYRLEAGATQLTERMTIVR